MSKEVQANTIPPDTAVKAAGAVLWRPGDDPSAPEVALIHRPRYDDWSLPKGKVDPGEIEPVTAVREIEEETGYRSRLGRHLADVEYPLGDRTKQVRYWAARATTGRFTPNAEVDELKWLPTADALQRLAYPQDREVLQRFTELPAETSTVLIVRHATAGSKSRWQGDDRLRPLDKNGRAQAESLVGVLLAFGADRLHAADRVRCEQTLAPLAEELGLPIQPEPTLNEESYAAQHAAGRRRLLDIAAAGGTPVVCTQGKVIPDLIGWWCELEGVRPDPAENRKGSVWVMSLVDGRLAAADHLASPLPTR